MLTIILVVLILAFCIRITGDTFRILGKIACWLVGMTVLALLIGGVFGLIGVLLKLAVYALPVILLVGIGVFIGKRLRGDSDVERIEHYPEQDVVDANGRVIR